MSNDPTTGAPDGARPNTLSRARRAFSSWLGRERDRRALAALDDRTLKDIGLSRGDFSAEAARWRWRA